ncbi:TlpA family protein disulfide reductase, partial [Fulvivirga sp. RKSG066]|uniref:TlpA family protein disulfide reductase n=1 Tax=Fulvivirga aurantia TaxID=2529383 RepID=UPI0012BD03F2
VVYLKEVVEMPHYWKKHQNLFLTSELEEALSKQKKNRYYHIIEDTFKSYFGTGLGQPAFNFSVYNSDGELVRLSDYRGKLVVLDVWATWCGPCISSRPDYQKIAEKYSGNEKISFLAISKDVKRYVWEKFLQKKGSSTNVTELYLPFDMNEQFDQHYFTVSIPRYILIDANGRIINANIDGPSIAMEKIIEDALSKI